MILGRESVRTSDLSKPDLRRAMKATIAALAPEQRWAQEDALAGRFSGLPGLAEAREVLLFVTAFPEELPTQGMLAAAYKMNKRVLCPRVDRRRRRLSLHRIADPEIELVPGSLGIPEPRAELPEVAPAVVDWALIPGLAFDHCGFRLGRGAGYYDRLLPLLRPDTTCWALCLSCQLVCQLPVEPHDQPLSGVSTPEQDVCGTRKRA